MKQNTPKSPIYFEYLDVVRFVAAFAVVIFHANEAWNYWFSSSAGFGNQASTGTLLLQQFLGNLRIGVDVFFLLSGFLITYILLEEKKRFGRISIGKFMIRRTLRIWPLYFFLIALSPLLVSWVGGQTPNYLANALFLGNFDVIRTELWLFPFNHFWTICIEEHFYLVWPFVIAFIPRKKMLSVFTIVIMVSLIFRLYIGMQPGGNNWYTLYVHTLSRMDVLIIGAVGAYFYSEKPFDIKLTRLVRYCLVLILMCSLVIEYSAGYPTMFLAGFKKYFYVAIISVLLLDYNFNPNFKHFLKKGSIIHYFGKISYGIYMYGNILVSIIIQKVFIPMGFNNKLLYYFILITVSLIVPIISFELFEKHILKFNKRFRVVDTKR